MRNRRYSDNDRHFWPFTLSIGKYRQWGAALDSGASDDEAGGCHARLHLGGVTLICELPKVLPDFRIRHWPQWDAATVARLGRDWYDEVFPREYGFTFVDGHLHLRYGPKTHDSTTTKSRCIFLPWRSWRFIRHSHYDIEGDHFHTEFESARSSWQATSAIREAAPKVSFELDDYDGQRIIAETHIEEREWRMGTGLFRWLSWFRRPKVSRDLAIKFNKEVGPEKGSWKGGTVGHSIEMLPGELHEPAFRRYCQQEHRSRSGPFRIIYVGKVQR